MVEVKLKIKKGKPVEAFRTHVYDVCSKCYGFQGSDCIVQQDQSKLEKIWIQVKYGPTRDAKKWVDAMQCIQYAVSNFGK